MAQLEQWGPEHCASVAPQEAIRYCRSLTMGHRENFSVLSRLTPESMRDGASAVYAFCRWADDLADESDSPEQAMALLGWWRGQLHACFQGTPEHPVFIALAMAIERHGLELPPFDALLDAFEQDQRVTRYETWEALLAYCANSANPVGRLVLRLAGADESPEQIRLSNTVCTGLQLANLWQDVQRDLVDRDRIYVPDDTHTIDDFQRRLSHTCLQGSAPDATFYGACRGLIQSLVDRTRPLLECVHPLVETAPAHVRPMLWLFGAGGLSVLRAIERSNCETVLFRPRVGTIERLMLLWKARSMRR
jgi:squalene synthase HpnC